MGDGSKVSEKNALERVSLSNQLMLHAPAYLVGAVTLAAFQFAMNRIDWLSKAAIDAIFSSNSDAVWHAAGLMLLLAIVAFALRVLSRWFIFNAGRDVEYELRALLLAKLHTLGTAFYRKMSSGEIMARATGDLLQVRLLAGFGVLNMINVVFAFTSAVQVMARISVRLTLVSFVMMPVLMLLTRSFSKGLFARTRQNQDANGRLSDVLQTNLAGVRVVRSFALEQRELVRFRTANLDYLKASLDLARLRGLMAPIAGAVSAVAVLACFWYGGSLLVLGPDHGGLTRGDFFAFWLALGRMTWPMIALGFSLAIVQRGRASYSRLKEVFDAQPEITDGDAKELSIVEPSLQVRKLTFAYGARKVLDDVSFDVPAGKSLAILGRTGAGKSTLAMLLARLLPTPPGAVKIGGQDVCSLPLAVTRSRIGYAQQDAFLFSTTVSRNIGLSLAEPDSDEGMERIRAASREAQVEAEVLGLPEQFDTVVGERGVQLSGGQKQRVALARALAREPPILVLDDPLSAVDAKTEAAILDAVERQAKKRTLVLVTHRIAAAARCDSVIVLDEGRVIERGTHEELVHGGGLYAAFAEEQSAETELDAIDLETLETPPPANVVDPLGRAG